MKNRNGLISGLRFSPHSKEAKSAWTISAFPVTRATDNYFIVPQNSKIGFAIAEVGDGIYTNLCESKRGVVQKSKIPALKTSCSDIGLVVNVEMI